MIPSVRYEKFGEYSFPLSGNIGFYCDEDLICDALAALTYLLPEAKFVFSEKDYCILAKYSEDLSFEEYSVLSKNGKIIIFYNSYLGLRNALSAFSLTVKKEGELLIVPEYEIRDYPEASHRGVMLDVARGVMPLERLMADIVLIAKARMNVLHLHLADSKGVAIELDSLPTEYRLEGYYTKSDVKKIVELCRVLAVEIIPEFDMPAHSTLLNKMFKNIRCKTDLEYQSLWTVCPGSEDAYVLYDKIIDETVAMFPGGRYFHIGGDEIEFLDLAEKEKEPRICHWEVCERCRKKMRDEGIRDRVELNYYFINRINETVKSHGRRTVIWSDQVDTTRDVGISRDVLFHFWRIAGRGRGPHDGCSMQGQLDRGYELINSHYPNTYVDLEEYMSSKNLADWRWDESPECREDSRDRIIGSEVCAWEYGNISEYPHYAYSLPSAIFLMADKLWSGEKRKFTVKDEIDLTRAVLGALTPAGFNVFSILGDIFPPRDNSLFYSEGIKASEKEIKDAIALLSREDIIMCAPSHSVKAYKACAEAALSFLKKSEE